MSAASMALKVAELTGVAVALDGEDLVLEATAEPPLALVQALASQKGSIVRLLQDLQQRADCDALHRNERRGAALPRDWAEGFAALVVGPPVAGFTRREWTQLVEDAEHFLDQWAEEAARLGWSTLDVFGVHRRAPSSRYDGMGLVPLIRGGRIVALTVDHATIRTPGGSQLTVLRRRLVEAIPIWGTSAPPQDETR